MVVVNFRLKKKNILLALAVLIGVAIIVILAFARGGDDLPSSDTQGLLADIDLTGDSTERRIDFLLKLGYETDGEEVESRDVVIPYEFNDVYENYNAIQLSQGFDLRDYCGCRVTQYCYEITNYEGYDGTVYAHILIYEGKIIGGDIAAAELNGFMHSFDKSQYYTAEDTE